MALCDIVTFQTVKQNLQHSRFFFGNKKLVSNLAKQQIFSRNVSNVKQLIGSMGDMDRIKNYLFFSYSRPPRPRSQINMTDCGLERYIVF